ncbi:unnamed protein product [Alternaria alternata]
MPYFSLLKFTDAEVREVLYLMLDANDIEFMDRYRDLGLPMRSSTVELIEKHFRSAYQPTKNTATPERGPTSVNDGMYLDDAMILDRESDEDGEGNDMVKDKGKGKARLKKRVGQSGLAWRGPLLVSVGIRPQIAFSTTPPIHSRMVVLALAHRAGNQTRVRIPLFFGADSKQGARKLEGARAAVPGKKVVRRAGSSTDSSGDIMEQGAMLGRSQGRGDRTTPTVDNTKSECFKRERSVSADSMDEVFGQGLLEGLDMHELDSHNGYQDGMPRGRSSTYPRLTPDNNTSVGDAKASSSKAQDHLF